MRSPIHQRVIICSLFLLALLAVFIPAVARADNCCKQYLGTTLVNCYDSPICQMGETPVQNTACSQVAECGALRGNAPTGCCTLGSLVCEDGKRQAECTSPSVWYANKQCSAIQACIRSATPTTSTTSTTTTTSSEPLTFTPNVPIPGFPMENVVVDESFLGRYINNFYIFFAGVAGIFAVVMMMWGGFHYIVSAGNPQKMNQGKEIISNAIIGLILVLTSYLLLKTINPNLVSLNIQSLHYIPQVLQTTRYCEAQGENAILAARQQNKACGAEVTYKNATGQDQKCVTLWVADENLRNRKYACFPHVTLDKSSNTLKAEWVVLPATKVCDDNSYTYDGLCDETQKIFAYQSWLDSGACRQMDMDRTLVPNRTNICKYQPYFTCDTGLSNGSPTDNSIFGKSTAVSCNIKGGNDSPCWRNDKPREFTPRTIPGTITGKITCIEPNPSYKPVLGIDALCCEAASKRGITCTKAACANDQVEVDCDPYNNDGSNDTFLNAIPILPGPRTCNEDRSGTWRCCAEIQFWNGDASPMG